MHSNMRLILRHLHRQIRTQRKDQQRCNNNARNRSQKQNNPTQIRLRIVIPISNSPHRNHNTPQRIPKTSQHTRRHILLRQSDHLSKNKQHADKDDHQKK